MLNRIASRGCRLLNRMPMQRQTLAAFSTSPAPIQPNSAEEFRSQDGYFDMVQTPANEDNRPFYYGLLGVQRVALTSIGRMTVVKMVSSLSASADVLALSSIEVDVGQIAEGTTVTVKWRGKPVFIRHRTPAEISEATTDDNSDLRDAQSDSERYLPGTPQWMIVVGICTHLGCVPISNAGEWNGWYCPCHGSHYDNSGRIRKGPAPLNLEVPEYSWLSPTLLKLG